MLTNTQFLKLHAYMYPNFLTSIFPITCRVRVHKFTIATRKVQSSPLWLLLPSQNPTHVNFFLSFLLIIIVPCKLLILSCDSPWLFQLFFIVVFMLPKLHTHNLFGKVLDPKKGLPLPSIVKPLLSMDALLVFVTH